ncbi:MAG: aspartate/tyrosine/aromatic aminotransferase [Burkholderiaceae bacterium]|jgi:aromatic-amino-acid transaminase|nr:aspartate/tyrosine/aromatic aminotransferase [Burkholderiaceae bacterium]MEB2350632.1 aspartate/tyrosine/aromatic aminotransferase [Burkholderiaceae bacterium]
MFETLEPSPPDKILSLIGLFRDDPRPGKIDLGIGVYRDSAGRTPVMRAVREAEKRLYDTEQTKAYLGPGGDPAYCAGVAGLVFGDRVPVDRLASAQTPGGAGALRILAGLIARAHPRASVWLPDPTWVNHRAIFADAGLATRVYPYFDPGSSGVRIEAMIAGLRQAAPGDVVLLHGCCHNPTGASLVAAEWEQVCELMSARGLVPFVDLAYQGFGDGLDQDAEAVRLFARRLPEMLIAVSNCKNFSIYRERTGCAFVLTDGRARADITQGQLLACARIAYSMPPDHGGSLVRIILQDPALVAQWREELESMRSRIVTLRSRLARTLADRSNSDRYDFLVRHRGMFSLIGTTPSQVERLRSEHAIYLVEDGRINVAGLTEDQIECFASAIVAVGR